MNLKMTIDQVAMLPDSVINRSINSLIYAVRRPMVLEAVKTEPNFTIIHTLSVLDARLAALAPTRVHTLDSTALFVLGAQPDERDDKTRRDAARAKLMRDVTDKRAAPPRTSAELERMIALEMQRGEDNLAENFGRAVDAVRLIESAHASDKGDEIEYDEAELPEYVVDGIVDKIVEVATRTYQDARRRLERSRFEFQKAEPLAAIAGALQVLDKFGVTEDEVIGHVEAARRQAAELFDKLEHAEVAPVPTIDEPPATTYIDPTTGRKVHRQSKKRAKGISSADMAQAAQQS